MLDWPALMRAGMLGLRLTPREFWQLTPAELRLMLGQGGGLLHRLGESVLFSPRSDPAPPVQRGFNPKIGRLRRHPALVGLR